jgi:hypothetical protein
MTLRKIRLELARDSDFPDGSRHHGYELVAPLDRDGRIDPVEWSRHRARCRVRRFWADEDDEVGHVVRKPGGAWAFHYDIHGEEDDDETGYRLAQHKLQLGEYVSIRDHDDDRLRTFRVVSVTEAE